ncbi:MAG: AMP-binding protein [Burkholderiales bacterium]
MSASPIRSLADIVALESRPYDEVVPVSSTFMILERSAALFGGRIALTFLASGQPGAARRDVTYAELLAQVCRAANLFRAMGVGADDAVAILAPNIPEAHFALWGAAVAGRACPINHMLNAEHIAALIKVAGARLIVALGPNDELDIWSKAAALAGLTGLPVLQIRVDTAAAGAPVFQDLLACRSDRLAFDAQLDRARIAACYHTGGTTGAPKLALHTHGNQVHTSWFASRYYDFDERTVEINGFPLFHVAGAFVYGLACLAVGARQILPTLSGMRSADFLTHYWHWCDEFGVTALACVPTILAQLMNLPPRGAAGGAVRVAYTGGSPLPTELAARFEDALSIPVRNILGMTECAGLVSIEPLHAPRVPGSTGLRLPYSECRAFRLRAGTADLNAPCAPGETGVIALKGPHVSPGYTDVRRNAGMFEGGWLISGDLGHVDDAGYIYVTGRAKDVIIRGSHNIDPGMVEEAFLAHPAVSMCAVVGEPDAHAGEVASAFVTLKPGAGISGAAILAEVAPQVAERPAVPKRVTIIDAMPVTAVGKVYKPDLRRIAIQTRFAELLGGVAGATLRPRCIDDAGVLRVEIEVAGERGDAETAAEVARLLGAIATPWRLKRA